MPTDEPTYRRDITPAPNFRKIGEGEYEYVPPPQPATPPNRNNQGLDSPVGWPPHEDPNRERSLPPP